MIAPEGDIHHRNETLTGPGDPWALLVVGTRPGPVVAGRARGRVDPTGPHRGEPVRARPPRASPPAHPVRHRAPGTRWPEPRSAAAWARRPWWPASLARLVTSENDHGYRAGNRYRREPPSPTAASPRRWRVFGGFDLAREEAERWSGVIEEEGNLGRTDLLAAAALVRQLGPAGAAHRSTSRCRCSSARTARRSTTPSSWPWAGRGDGTGRAAQTIGGSSRSASCRRSGQRHVDELQGRARSRRRRARSTARPHPE